MNIGLRVAPVHRVLMSVSEMVDRGMLRIEVVENGGVNPRYRE